MADLQKQAQELRTQVTAAQTVRQEAVEAQMASDSRRDVAEARLLRVQDQLVKATDAASVMQAELSELRHTAKVCGGGAVLDMQVHERPAAGVGNIRLPRKAI